MKIAILTSSRADFGIYLPLLKKLCADPFFDVKIFAFGTHLSHFHGYTLDKIEAEGFEVAEKVESLISGDSEEAISNSIGNTIIKFSSIWAKWSEQLDLVFSLGDRFEMFAATTASIPFNIPIAHIHGGETTLGAIDNIFRHSISLMSVLHFASTQAYCEKLYDLTGAKDNIHYVGALSLENLLNMELYNKASFLETFNISLSIPTILVTYHPETVSVKENRRNANVLVEVFSQVTTDYQVIITLPNADTMGAEVRKIFLQLDATNDKVKCVENFGSLGYFSCMKHSAFLLGNTSSGIIEAASLNKYVINIGDRQKGRLRSENVIDSLITKEDLLSAVNSVEGKGEYHGGNIYQNGALGSELIIQCLKQRHST